MKRKDNWRWHGGQQQKRRGGQQWQGDDDWTPTQSRADVQGGQKLSPRRLHQIRQEVVRNETEESWRNEEGEADDKRWKRKTQQETQQADKRQKATTQEGQNWHCQKCGYENHGYRERCRICTEQEDKKVGQTNKYREIKEKQKTPTATTEIKADGGDEKMEDADEGEEEAEVTEGRWRTGKRKAQGQQGEEKVCFLVETQETPDNFKAKRFELKVERLPEEFDEEDLMKYMGKLAKVKEVHVPKMVESGPREGLNSIPETREGYVNFIDEKAAFNLVKRYGEEVTVNGMKLTIKVAMGAAETLKPEPQAIREHHQVKLTPRSERKMQEDKDRNRERIEREEARRKEVTKETKK